MLQTVHQHYCNVSCLNTQRALYSDEGVVQHKHKHKALCPKILIFVFSDFLKIRCRISTIKTINQQYRKTLNAEDFQLVTGYE